MEALQNDLDNVTDPTQHPNLIVFFGEMLIDFVPTVSRVSLVEAPAFKKALGGAPTNIVLGIASDAGAPRRTSESLKTPRTKEEILTTKPINWNILKPIMAFYDEKCNVMDKYPQGLNRDLRSKMQCKWANNALGV